MPTVSQTRMQASVNSANGAMTGRGISPSGAATPGGFEAFLAALDQSQQARNSARNDSDRFGNQNALPEAIRRQNLPILNQESSDAAKNSDPMQILMAQLAAQGMVTQAASQALSTQNNGDQSLAIASATSQIAANSQSSDLQALLANLNVQGGDSSQALMAMLGQQMDPKQLALITQALTKAMKANGQAPDAMMQSQLAALLQSVQDGGPQNTQNQDGAKSSAQIASIIQTFAQKNGINLPPDIQAQLSNLINQGKEQASGIKLVGIEGATTMQPGAVDPTKANTIQNLTEGGRPLVMTNAADKLQKIKTLDSSPALNVLADKNRAVKALANNNESILALAKGQGDLSKPTQMDQLSAQIKNDPTQNDPSSAQESYDLLSAQNTIDQSNLTTLNVANSGISRFDSHATVPQKVEIKASDVSLVSGPLHSEVLSAAKSGGGRIMLELTPPEQGTIRLDLRINSAGQAHLIVEGASEATKSRLDQGGQNLKNEFAQMGLNLSLDLRQGNQSQQMRDQASFGGRQVNYGNISSNTQVLGSASSVNSIGSGDNRGNSSTVHLYA